MPLIPTDTTADVDLAAAIAAEKQARGAVILAHYYQEAAIQEVADFVGDSLDLARRAASVEAEQIVFCGVHFMAETAKILNPHKPVLLPDLDAGCSLAESAPADGFGAFVADHPDHVVVTYVNSTAAVKALSDYCVTSTNAVDVIRSIPEDQPIIFAPDQYLGDWVSRETGRDLLCWKGSCEVHELFSESAIREQIEANPGAGVLVHPECPAPVRALATHVGSTKRLLNAVAEGAPDATWIVVTEPGIIHQMAKSQPGATFIDAPAEVVGSQDGACTSCNTCPHMRLNTLEKLYRCLVDQTPQIHIESALIERARLPIERMLAVG